MEKIVVENFSGVYIGFYCDQNDKEIDYITSGDSNDDPFEETSSKNSLSYTASLRETLRQIISSFSEDVQSIASKATPDEVELNFSLSLEKECKFWLIGGKGQGKVDIKLKWNEIK